MSNKRFHPIDPKGHYYNKPHWNGMPCEAEIGSVVVAKEVIPTWWSAPFAGQRIPCIKVTAADNAEGDMSKGKETFFILCDTTGFNKVFHEGGGPQSGHASITVDDPNTFVALFPSEPKRVKL